MAANEPLPEVEIGLEQAGLTDSSTYDLPKRRRENSLAYEGIPLDSKNLRLIRIQPSDQLHDRISCSLTAVPFGRRPKYQALSYVWGTDTASETIEVNGVAFQIGSNLLGALRFLSTMRNDAAAQDGFWIDAICINQDDIHEKNAQLSIMGQIYFRARSVLVWLKNGSSQTASAGVDQQQRISESQSKLSITSKEKAMLLEDPYWDRLWILQELGRARRILVCLRLHTVPWKEFVALVVGPPSRFDEDIPDRGPIWLDTVIVQAKYATLEQLLCDHIHAKCSNRLDKIYGLLGLAIDGFRFPVDYRKTRFEVWRDTIRFISETIETDLTSMARLVKELLTRDDLVDPQGHQSGCFRQLTPREKDAKLRVETLPPAKQGLTLTAAIMGIIAKVGPPVLDCVAEPVQWSNWRDQVQLSLKSPADKDAAIRANDKLFTSLLDLEDAQILNLCSSRAGPHMWGAGDDALVGDAALQAAQWAERLSLESRLADRPPASGASLSLPRFCLLEAGGAARQPMAPATQLGLVPGVARPGDMLCRVRNSSRALLVRTMPKRDAPGSPGGGGAAMYVRGVATVAEDVGLGPEPPDYDARWRSVQNFPMMRVVLDAETLLQLIE
ncbi:hypothetical protein GGTG_07183 [Gaeumannomyces tritici R3-111a-1]|uniref:Heterokaryon incompatibility domain-containing protein n=1 Tax=Gaeumannomyces tritici (strain R3-111a-1) TaxID=644352 RepID=J3P0Y7_GAET3|nr:hypothetical protein GGTG_07183 [Gaeumannomyces tritici R3-111a-1]EJT77271.1 hypothetical protein GGTG_07183 [Gaeumannomyces tritici R3-111a-1]